VAPPPSAVEFLAIFLFASSASFAVKGFAFSDSGDHGDYGDHGDPNFLRVLCG